MSAKALKVMVEVKLRAVSCPGVHLPLKHDLHLSVCLLDQCRLSQCVPAVFPLLLHEKLIFEKIFREAMDPADITVMLECETVRVELVQLLPPAGDVLASFEEDARRFLFPEPRLVPSSSSCGLDRAVLMTRAPDFPGIAPRLEFSTRTTITECPADDLIHIHPNVLMKPWTKRSRKFSSRPSASSPQRNRPRSSTRRQGGSRTHSGSRVSRSPQTNSQRLGHLSLDPGASATADSSLDMLTLWPEARHCDSTHVSAVSTNPSPPGVRSTSAVRFSPTGDGNSHSLVVESEDESKASDEGRGPDPSDLWRSHREEVTHNRSSPRRSHREWEEVHERVRGLLTTPTAVRRLIRGATVSEVEEVLARSSICVRSPP